MISKQLQSYLEWTQTSFEQSLMEFYTTLLEKLIQVVLGMLEIGIQNRLEWFSDVQVVEASHLFPNPPHQEHDTISTRPHSP
jgi:hypothetical protein